MSNILSFKPTAHAEVIETEFSMLLMSNYYKKEDLTPISLIGALPGMTIGNNTINTKTSMHLGTTVRHGFRHKVMGITKDPYMDNRYYFSVNGHHSNTNNTNGAFCIAYETDKDISILATVGLSNIEFIEVLDIDQNFIYVSAQNLTAWTHYIYKVDKLTYAASVIYTIATVSRTKIQLIYKDETYLYFLARSTYGTWSIARYNKSNSEVINKSITPASNSTMQYNNVEFMDFYYNNGYYYFCMPKLNGTGEDFNLLGYRLNTNVPFTNDDAIEEVEVNIKGNENLLWAPFGGYANYRFWIKDGFLFYAIYDEDYVNNTAIGIQVQGIHKFKITGAFQLTYVSTLKINKDKKIISMIFDSDRTHIAIGYNLSMDFLKYNSVTHEYENTNKEVQYVQSAGFDSLDRLWYMTSTYGVHVHNIDDPQEVILKFEYEYYSYRGFDIESFITFEAKSFINTVPLGKYKIILGGNVYFKNTGTKEIEFNYTGGENKYDIVINGRNRLTCCAEFTKTW